MISFRRSNVLKALAAGTLALLMAGSAFAGKDEPGALKKDSTEAKALAGRLDSIMDQLSTVVKDLETATDAVTKKGDKAAIEEADKKIAVLKSQLSKLDDESKNLRKIGMKMDKELERLKAAK